MQGLGAPLGTLLTSMLTDRQERLLEFLLQHMGNSSCFNAMHHEAFRLLPPPEAGAAQALANASHEWQGQNGEGPRPRWEVCGCPPWIASIL